MKRSVVAVIFNDSREKVLLLKRRDVPIWVLPGGGIEIDEPPEAAALREVEEETGLQVIIKRKAAEYTPINHLAYPTYLFECLSAGGLPFTGMETKEIGFFNLDQLPQPFFFLHQDWLNDCIRNETTTLFKPITQVTYLNLLKYTCCHPLWVLRLALSRLGFPLNSKIS